MPDRLKIAQIVSTFPPYRGGMGNVAYYITDYLSRLKYDVIVFTPLHSLEDQDYKSFFKVKHLLPQFRYGNAAEVLQLFFHCYRYDVIHFHYPFIGALLPVFLLKIFRGKKLNLIVHYQMDLLGFGARKVIFKLYNKLFGLIVRVADKIVVSSLDYAKESFIAKYLEKYKDKFVVIPNGVDVDFFKPMPKSVSLVRKYGLEDKKTILFVGALDSAHYFKGINFLIKAFHILHRQDAKLIIVGEGDLKQVYKDLAESFGISGQVEFTGYIPDEKLPEFYNLCDIFVLPSIDRSEAFGMVLLEAMACGKAVIASDLPGVREVVGIKQDSRIVKPKDVEALAKEINLLLENKRLRENLGKAGRDKVVEKYSWDRVVNEFLKLYKRTGD